MIKIHYEVYKNDYDRTNKTATFDNLKQLKDWLFGQMKRPYNEDFAMYFPNPNRADAEPSTIEIQPVSKGEHIWIHLISNNDGIIFSDGLPTSGQKHWNEEIKTWLTECRDFRREPKFNFV